MTLIVKKLSSSAIIPSKATDGSAAFDIYSDENCVISERGQKWIGTGIAVSIDPCKCGLVWPRSGMAGKGITTDAGLIDSDYRGEVKVLLVNRGDYQYIVNRGDRIAQMLITSCFSESIQERNELPVSGRGENGFGSSGQ